MFTALRKRRAPTTAGATFVSLILKILRVVKSGISKF